MTELKTLKDLGYFTDVCEFPKIWKKSKEEAVFKWELKAEAVKWVKEIIKDQNKKGNLRSNHMNPRKQGQIYFIKYFFNLTEEDLK